MIPKGEGNVLDGEGEARRKVAAGEVVEDEHGANGRGGKSGEYGCREKHGHVVGVGPEGTQYPCRRLVGCSRRGGR